MFDKIIVCDISNTLLNSSGKVDNEIFDIIKLLNKMKIGFILCSGGARIRTLGLANAIGASKYIISSNGADVYCSDSNIVIYNNIINIDIIKKIYIIAQEYDLRIAFNAGNYIYTNQIIYYDGLEKEISKIQNFEKVATEIVQCIASGYNQKAVTEFLEKIDYFDDIKFVMKNIDNNIDINNIRVCYADIVKAGTSKGKGLLNLCNYLGIDKENVIAIGDNVNDLSLFDYSGYNVAMGNAIKELKEKSDFVTCSNDEAGVSKFLKKMLKRM